MVKWCMISANISDMVPDTVHDISRYSVQWRMVSAILDDMVHARNQPLS